MSPQDDERVGIDQVTSDGEPPEFDLRPRTTDTGPGRGHRRRWLAVGVLVVVVAAAGFLVTKTLGSATDYFHQVDEAVAQRADLGTRRFRIQGTVVNEPTKVRMDGNQQVIDFVLGANGVTAPVVYTGSDPPALFKRCEPVVIVGHWESSAPDAPFVGSQIIIKHDENYTEAHADRMDADATCGSVAAQ